MKRTPLRSKVGLKRKTPLKASKGLKTNHGFKIRKKINPVSKKQREANKVWHDVVHQKAEDLDYICQWCGRYGKFAGENPLTGHHIIKRSQGRIDTYANAFICHWWSCHTFIEQNMIDVNIIHNLKEYTESIRGK